MFPLVISPIVLSNASLQNQWHHFGVDEHPFATDFDVHQGYDLGFDPQPRGFQKC